MIKLHNDGQTMAKFVAKCGRIFCAQFSETFYGNFIIQFKLNVGTKKVYNKYI